MLYGSVGRLGLRALAGVAFSPLALFASGAPGVWYDPSDLTTMFQDAAGTTPVTAVEQPVGLRLDKSRGLVLGSELNDGTLTSVSNWIAFGTNTTAQNGDAIEITFVNNAAGAYQQLRATRGLTSDLTVGKWYKVTGQAKVNTGSANITINTATVWTSAAIASTSYVEFTIYFLADNATTNYIAAANLSTGEVLSIRAVSVRELPGSHAYQTTDINRPVLSARYNLLTRTEEFDNAAWVKTRTSTTASSLTETATTGSHILVQSVTYEAGTYRFNLEVKPNGRTWIVLQARGSFSYFELAGAGSLGSTSGTVVDRSITALSDGYYLCSLSVTATAGSDNVTIYLATANGTVSYTGDGTSGVLLRKADLRVSNDGVGLPAYQRVTTATDYDTTGFPLYLRYNGTNSTMQTAAIDFLATDAMSIFAGVRKLSDTAQGIFAELSADVNSNSGSFFVSAPQGAANTYGFRSRGNAVPAAFTASTFAAPITNVVTCQSVISTDAASIRVNGTAVASSTDDQGIGNFGNYALYLGARGGSSLWFNGRDYGLVVLGRTATATEIANTEAWMNGKTAAYGPPVDIEILTRDGSTILTRDGSTVIARNT